jgi:hypothetical protein
VADEVDASVDFVEAARAKPMDDLGGRDSGVEQLPARNRPVLPGGE